VQARISASAIMLAEDVIRGTHEAIRATDAVVPSQVLDEGDEDAESAFHHQNEAQQKFEINPQVRGRLLNYLSIHAQAREFLGRTPVERVKALPGRFERMTDEDLLFVFPLLDYKSLMNLLWTCKAFRDIEADEPTNKASWLFLVNTELPQHIKIFDEILDLDLSWIRNPQSIYHWTIHNHGSDQVTTPFFGYWIQHVLKNADAEEMRHYLQHGDAQLRSSFFEFLGREKPHGIFERPDPDVHLRRGDIIAECVLVWFTNMVQSELKRIRDEVLRQLGPDHYAADFSREVWQELFRKKYANLSCSSTARCFGDQYSTFEQWEHVVKQRRAATEDLRRRLQDFNNILQLNEILRRAAQGDLESVEKLIEEHFQEQEGIPFAMSQGPVMRGTCERERHLLEAKAWAIGKLQSMQGMKLDGGMDLPAVVWINERDNVQYLELGDFTLQPWFEMLGWGTEGVNRCATRPSAAAHAATRTHVGETEDEWRQYWREFCERVRQRDVAPTRVLDFAYTDRGHEGLNLSPENRLLERLYCFEDRKDDIHLRRVILKVHTLHKWGERVDQLHKRTSKVTAVKFLYADWNPSPLVLEEPRLLVKVKFVMNPPSAPGLKWKDVGSEKPSTGTEIENELLAAALQKQVEFKREEWKKIHAGKLSSDSYIKSGDRYFKPTASELKLLPVSKQLQERWRDAYRDNRHDELEWEWSKPDSMPSADTGDGEVKRVYDEVRAAIELGEGLFPYGATAKDKCMQDYNCAWKEVNGALQVLLLSLSVAPFLLPSPSPSHTSHHPRPLSVPICTFLRETLNAKY
jgi:hypothetical protein